MLDLIAGEIRCKTHADCVARFGDRVVLTAIEDGFSRTCGKNSAKHTYITEGCFSFEDYIVLEYTASALRRQEVAAEPIISAQMTDGCVPLALCRDIFIEPSRHRLIVPAPYGECRGLRIEFHPERCNRADFTIFALYTCRADELPKVCSALVTDRTEPFCPIELGELYNGTYRLAERSIDGGAFFTDEQVTLAGVPFAVRTDGNNLIAPPGAPRENDEIITNFGARAKRGLCRPISRDSIIEIPVNMRAGELFFLLAMTGSRCRRWGFASDGPIIGTYCGDVMMPLIADDVESFCVEIVYADGRRDIDVPYNLATGRHGAAGDFSLCAVPTDFCEIRSVIFHNRIPDTDICVAALTVNPTGVRLLPQMLIPEPTERASIRPDGAKRIGVAGQILEIRNGALSMDIDISSGMRLVGLENAFTPQMKSGGGHMLKIETADGKMVCDFESDGLRLEENCAVLRCRHGELLLEIRADISEENTVLWELSAKNTGKCELSAAILFPCTEGLAYASRADSRYFFPKYQNLDSDEDVFIYEESAPSFPMQFFDLYSGSQNGGLAVLTRERGLVVRKYALKKDARGMDFYIEYPKMYGKIAPGGVFCASPTAICAHAGDWRTAFALYKNWLGSWYEPFRCQDKKWYRESFWLLAEITDFYETTEFTKLPVWFDREKKEFNFLKILEEQKSITGIYPDILHLWSWAYRVKDGEYSQQWGNFGSTDYDEYGGAENFSRALHEVTEKTGAAVSLYLHPTLLSARYPQAEKYFPRHRVTDENGGFISVEGDSYRMCHANDEWRAYAIEMYRRIYRELKIPLLYVDEFSLRVENRCYNPDHGHDVPSNLLKTDREFISALRSAMPEEVVLYGEYAAADVNARYIDCNITYYILDSIVDMIETAYRAGNGDDRLGRVMTDVYRFAFPKIVQLVLPMALRNLSWQPLKFIFFNGEAIYDSFWDTDESRALDFTVKAYKIKKKYADCFSSDCPETMVDTLSPAICANRFPGGGRTIYTLYNRAYTTFRGGALRLLHEPGTVYFDVWNDAQIDAEIDGSYAVLPYELHAQHIGCIEVRRENL